MVCGKEEGEEKIDLIFSRVLTLVYVHKQLSAVLRMNGEMSDPFSLVLGPTISENIRGNWK